MRPLAVLGDNITTDHLSPSNAILLDSAAGEYLAKMGLPEEDFNSYATHRGDHLTAQRATFANPTLINEMAIVDGAVKKGSLARVEPDGKVMRMWEAIETYMNRKQPLIVVAGADYGEARRATGRRRARGSRASRRSPPKASSGSTART